MKHKHHIVPKHMGGTDDPSNLIELTIDEHAESHRILFEQHGKWQDRVAWQALSGNIGKEEILTEFYKNLNKGRIPSSETREKMAEAKKGRKISAEHKKALTDGRKNSKNSPEHIAILKTIWKDKKLTKEHKEKIGLSKKNNPKNKEIATNAGKISQEKYKNDPERQKQFSERMKLWWKTKKEKELENLNATR